VRLLLGQFAITFLVWLGLAFFFAEMNEGSKVIFYLVTSWLLYLLVVIVKTWFREHRKTKGTNR